MNVKTIAMAGTLESSDVSIVVEPSRNEGITLELNSLVEKQYGEQIKCVVLETLEQLKVKKAIVKIHDKGALDCVIIARLQTAVLRAAGVETFNWEEEK
ncbi:citrate lyase subunit gamma (acyl carrier protein) [Anaerovirgula multivorans]|uniref:Citrate lyase acyl carrier protein n=1 Tax=Anaerovirgula multivorans TaxID=312168 RepID=A0A239FU82_9FIRM|nr:citrate lyase acyl carrier protein [Anaerovirgula multivorans]SNS59474.1 citrate lyase subunit gamma (acyl carrier protein) [Anaerovirgula multivorans]